MFRDKMNQDENWEVRRSLFREIGNNNRAEVVAKLEELKPSAHLANIGLGLRANPRILLTQANSRVSPQNSRWSKSITEEKKVIPLGLNQKPEEWCKKKDSVPIPILVLKDSLSEETLLFGDQAAEGWHNAFSWSLFNYESRKLDFSTQKHRKQHLRHSLGLKENSAPTLHLQKSRNGWYSW